MAKCVGFEPPREQGRVTFVSPVEWQRVLRLELNSLCPFSSHLIGYPIPTCLFETTGFRPFVVVLDRVCIPLAFRVCINSKNSLKVGS